MTNANYNVDDMNPTYPAMGMDEGDGIQGDDVEIDNRIKELLLSTHNLYLVGQMHEKEIKELGPVIKDLPQLIGGVMRSVGELGGQTGEGGAQEASSSGGFSLLTLLLFCLGTAVVSSVLTVGLIKLLVV